MQAARYDNYQSVTTSLVTEGRSCFVNSPLLPHISSCTFTVHGLSHPFRAHAFHIVIVSLTCIHVSLNVIISKSQFSEKNVVQIFLLADTDFQHCCSLNMTIIEQRSSASLFDTDLTSLDFTKLAIQVVTSDKC